MNEHARFGLGLTLGLAAMTLISCGLWVAAFLEMVPLEIAAAVGGAASLLGAVLALAFYSKAKRRIAESEEELERQARLSRDTADRIRKESRQEMESFRSALAHSLRMPVAIIQGYAELLAGGMVSAPDVRQDYLEKIAQRSRDMSEVMNRHFTPKDSIDKTSLSYSQLDLIELIRQAAADMQTAAREQGILVQLVSPVEQLTIQADSYLLNRVLFNLLENALKYMGRPGIVTIRVVPQGEQVSIAVQDDGLGMASEEVESIFKAYYQGSNHTDGSGYGLYLVHQAAVAHGGTVTAQSAPGRGMGITLTIPLKPAKDALPV